MRPCYLVTFLFDKKVTSSGNGRVLNLNWRVQEFVLSTSCMDYKLHSLESVTSLAPDVGWHGAGHEYFLSLSLSLSSLSLSLSLSLALSSRSQTYTHALSLSRSRSLSLSIPSLSLYLSLALAPPLSLHLSHYRLEFDDDWDGAGRAGDLIRTSIHDEYDLMLIWHVFLSILRV